MSTARRAPAERLDPVAVAAGVSAHLRESEFVLYESDGTFRLGVGVDKRIIVHRDEIEIQHGSRIERRACADPFVELPRALAAIGAADRTAYGYVAFDAAHAHLPYRKHADYPSVHVIVPSVELAFDGSTLSARAPGDPQELLDAALGAPAFATRAPSVLAYDEGDAEARFSSVVQSALAAIRGGRFEKVIVSRAVTFDGELDVLATHANARRGGAARRFAFRLGRVSGVGSSPSPVLVCDGRSVTTLPLAGTRHRGKTPEEDAKLTAELFADAKEVREHAISVRRALAELVPVCVPDSVVVAEFMSVVRYAFTQHLASRIRGELRPEMTAWDALRAVFPAVTVTGVEKAPAVACIDELESVPRGVYGGAVGVFGPGRETDTGLAIRSVFGCDGRVVLNAGAGIVSESETGFEFRESREKMRTMLVNVVMDPAGGS